VAHEAGGILVRLEQFLAVEGLARAGATGDYLDVATITVGVDRWQTEDHYLDLVVRTGRVTELVDVDELLEAHLHGLLSTGTAQGALRTAVTAIAGLAAHGHDLGAWLSTLGMELSWR
jgi:predicted RNA-binding protein associated with RNAse of E/G family